MPTPMTYDKMIRNRARLFSENKINKVFEPFIGKTYFCEGQKKILFIAYDEWSYRTGVDKSNLKPSNRKPSEYMSYEDATDIKRLFLLSQHHKHIDTVLKGIESRLTVEDVAYYNFLVRPIEWNDYKKYKEVSSTEVVKESVELFELVIDFCNPDIVIFCSREDYDYVNDALNSKLNSFLRERGIEYLESGNLNYDTNISPEIDEPTHNKRNDVREFLIPDFDYQINGMIDENDAMNGIIDENKFWDFDYTLLDLQQVTPQNERKYPKIPDELQKLASFIDSELKSTGSFTRHRIHQVLKELERDVQKDFFILVDQIKGDLYDNCNWMDNPSCSTTLPNMFKALHKLKAIINEYEKATIEPTVPKRKLCCSYASKNKREFLLEKQAKEFDLKKQKLIKQAQKIDQKKQEHTKKLIEIDLKRKRRTFLGEEGWVQNRWKQLGNRNSTNKKRQQEERSRKQKYDSLLFQYINGYSLSNEEYQTLVDDCEHCIGCSFEELQEKEDNIYRESKYDEINQFVIEPFFKQITNMIEKDPKISLEALSKAALLDEYYLSRVLEEWGFKNEDGQWIVPKD